jgi:hypothetical protein
MTRHLPVLRGIARRIEPAVGRWPIREVLTAEGSRKTRRR